ncbi:MAG: hypothetical protein PVG65_05260 [Candidatus Thorarchaeota archaeon]|jgi:hypothetical protein
MIKKVVSLIILVLFLVGIAQALAGNWDSSIISHKLRVVHDETYPPGAKELEYHLTSLPEGVVPGPFSSALIVARYNGVWEEDPIFSGPWGILPDAHKIYKETFNRVSVLQYILDSIFPDEKTIAIGLYTFRYDMHLYFDVSKWKDKEFHEKAAKKLNEKIQQYKRTK